MSIEKIVVDAFDVLPDAEDGPVIVLDIDEKMVTSATLSYDGRNCMILVRNNQKAFLLTNILPTIRKKLLNAEKVIIVEQPEANIEPRYIYAVEVDRVDEIPYPDNYIEDAKACMDNLRGELGEEKFDEFMKKAIKTYKKCEN